MKARQEGLQRAVGDRHARGQGEVLQRRPGHGDLTKSVAKLKKGGKKQLERQAAETRNEVEGLMVKEQQGQAQSFHGRVYLAGWMIFNEEWQKR